MARKSRKNISEVVSSATVQTEVSRPFRAGLYARISMETKETLERGTIETQVELVKDFSRFGRDYLEVGFYIEYIFPLLQIRFISINDSYDSAASSGMTGGMNVALQNLVCNMYSLDLSKKISSAMQTRTKNGTRLPVNARYGYKKGKDGRLEVDPEAAKVVKMIFQMAAEGTSLLWEDVKNSRHCCYVPTVGILY